MEAILELELESEAVDVELDEMNADVSTQTEIELEPVAVTTTTTVLPDISPDPATPDPDLLALALAGSDAAFSLLYRRHYPKLRWHVSRILRDYPNDIDDVTQEAITRAFMRLDQYAGRCKLHSWLVQIAINGALMHRRKMSATAEASSRMVALDIDIEDHEGTRSSLIEHDFPEEDLGYRRFEMKEEVAGILSRMPEGILREALRMKFLEGMTGIEIARRTGVPLATVKSRVWRGLKEAREVVEGMGRGREGGEGKGHKWS
jgi:RNA polymerase sigma-70 factor, ECF subfamily